MPLLLGQTKVKTQDESEDADDQDNNPEAPPLHLACSTSGCDALVEMDVAGLGVLLDVLGMLLGLLDHGFLDDNGFGQVLKELVELDKGALDLLNVVVTGANSS